MLTSGLVNRFLMLTLSLLFVFSIVEMASGRDFAFEKDPDILIYGRLNHSFTDAGVGFVRQFIANYNAELEGTNSSSNKIADPFSNVQKGTIRLVEKLVSDDQDEVVSVEQDLLRKMALGLFNRVFNGLQLRLELVDLHYDMDGFSTNVEVLDGVRNEVDFDIDLNVGNIKLGAKKIIVALEAPIAETGEIGQIIQIEFENPILSTSSTLTAGTVSDFNTNNFNIDFNLKTYLEDGAYRFGVSQGSFDDLGIYVENNHEQIDLDLGTVYPTNPTVLLWGGDEVWIAAREECDCIKDLLLEEQPSLTELELQQIKIHHVDIAEYLSKYSVQFKTILMREMMKIVRDGAGEELLKMLEEFPLQRELWINMDPLYTYMKVDEIGAINTSKQDLAIVMSGAFCLVDEYEDKEKLAQCMDQQFNYKYPGPTTHRSMENSIKALEKGFTEDNLVVSVSEDYINRVLLKTIESGSWDESLERYGLAVNKKNPNPIVVRLDKAGDSATAFLDLEYIGFAFWQKLFLGKRAPVQVPIQVDATVEILNDINNVPVLNIKIVGANMTDDFLLNGNESIGLKSSLGKFKLLKGLLLKIIKNQLQAQIEDNESIEIELPNTFQNTPLNEVKISFDGFGRALGKFKISNRKSINDYVDDVFPESLYY